MITCNSIYFGGVEKKCFLRIICAAPEMGQAGWGKKNFLHYSTPNYTESSSKAISTVNQGVEVILLYFYEHPGLGSATIIIPFPKESTPA
jgi:hypothetical protein